MNSGEDYRFGRFHLSLTEQVLFRDGKPLSLPPKAFETLRLLVENHGRVLAREEIMQHVWPDSFVEENNLAQNISLLRRTLDEPGWIETVPKRGYRFSGPIAAADAPPAPAPAFVLTDQPPETRYARSGDVNIAYQVVGDGPIDVVFVMGWVSHLEYFWTEPHFARFLRRIASFSRLILFDKRGTGLSDRVPLHELPTLEQRMDDLRAVMDAVGSSRAAILSVSEGGPMSALFSATYPEKTLALVMIGTYAKRLKDPSYPWGPTEEERAQFIQEIGRTWGGPVGIEDRAPTLMHDQRFRDWWATYLRMGASPGAAIALTRMNADIDVRHVLPSVRVPTLVLHRSGDQTLKVEEGRYIASLIPGARFVELPGVDHLPFVGDQEAMLEHIEQFLSGISHSAEPERVLATVLFVKMIPGRSSGVEPLKMPQFQAQVRREVEWFGGRNLNPVGEGPVASFDGPARGIRCAHAVAELAARFGLPVGAALHTGECDLIGESGIAGIAVDIAERIVLHTRPTEVLVSRTVKDLVAGSGIVFQDRGLLNLSDALGQWRLFQVMATRAAHAAH